MSILVIGTGRSGTNIILEILAGSSKLISPGTGVLHKFSNTKKIPGNSVVKVDIVNFDELAVKNFVKLNPGVKLIWSIRDPRDICMSKIKRGVPMDKGGDCVGFSPDGTTEGSVESLRLMVRIYKHFKNDSCSMLVRMEDVLLNTEDEIRKICSFIGVPYERDMIEFYKRMRNKRKRERYNNKDLSQIGLWRTWKTAYGGYFDRNKIDMEKVFDNVADIRRYFGYDR